MRSTKYRSVNGFAHVPANGDRIIGSDLHNLPRNKSFKKYVYGGETHWKFSEKLDHGGRSFSSPQQSLDAYRRKILRKMKPMKNRSVTPVEKQSHHLHWSSTKSKDSALEREYVDLQEEQIVQFQL